jgi:hypothetical protein
MYRFWNAFQKLRKFLYGPMKFSPSVTSENMNTPRIENMKSVNIRRMQTLASAPIESVIVDIKA